MKRFPLRSEEEESMEEEEEEMEDATSNVFDFEDVEDLDDVVDYRPRGENRIENSQNRERRANEKYPGKISHEFLQNEETLFLTLDSLDEEADSDESGYVEAPPKSLLGSEDKKEEENENSRLESFGNQSESVITCRNVETDENENQRTKHEDSKNKQEEIEPKKVENKDSLLMVDDNQRIKERERERTDFKYPISETIKKLANASLRNSKSLEMTNNSCLNVLNNFKTSKSFDSVKNEDIIESPSLHQRKQLLAQRGVMV